MNTKVCRRDGSNARAFARENVLPQTAGDAASALGCLSGRAGRVSIMTASAWARIVEAGMATGV